MDAPAPSAPAQPAPVSTTPDVDPGPGPAAPSAPARIDTGQYLLDRKEQDTGQKPPAEPKAPEPVVPSPPVSKRQQVINDYERQLAEARERIARLEGRIEQPREPAPAPPVEKPVTEAAYKRYLALPDAPKLDDFESIAEHTAAMALFIADRRWEDHARTANARVEQETLTASERERADGFAERVKQAVSADKEFRASVSDEVLGLQSLAQLDETNAHARKSGMPIQQAGPANLVAEELLSSPVAPQLMRELSKPGALARLIAGPDLSKIPPNQRPSEHARWIVREIGKLEARADAPAPAAEPVKLLTEAEPPLERLGRKPNVPDDPVEAALKRKDTGAYLEERRRQDLARARR